MRPIRPEDAEAVAALIRHSFAGLPVNPPPSALRVTAGDIRVHLEAGGGGVVRPPAECCLLWAERDGALYLSRIAVDPAHRRQGLAVAMIQAAERHARRRGLPRLTLSTRLALAGNRRLFAACGFVEIGRSAHPGFAAPTSVDLEKTLPNPRPSDASHSA